MSTQAQHARSKLTDHLRACFYVNEIFNDEFKDRDFAEHMGIMTEKERLMALVDSLVMCKFGQRNGQFTPDICTELLEALTGFELDTRGLYHIGERIYNLERLYNIREGIEEISLPKRIFTEPLEDTMGTTPPLDTNHYEKAKRNYFAAIVESDMLLGTRSTDLPSCARHSSVVRSAGKCSAGLKFSHRLMPAWVPKSMSSQTISRVRIISIPYLSNSYHMSHMRQGGVWIVLALRDRCKLRLWNSCWGTASLNESIALLASSWRVLA